jgi:hypothetical protein
MSRIAIFKNCPQIFTGRTAEKGGEPSLFKKVLNPIRENLSIRTIRDDHFLVRILNRRVVILSAIYKVDKRGKL